MRLEFRWLVRRTRKTKIAFVEQLTSFWMIRYTQVDLVSVRVEMELLLSMMNVLVVIA